MTTRLAPRDASATPDPVAEVRRFNRFYTTQLGLLQEGLSDSPFSLTEARVLYEIAHRAEPTASALRADLGIDAGYLSRILAGLQRRGLIRRRRSEEDARRSIISLTPKGAKAFEALDQGTQRQVGGIISTLSHPEQDALVRAMRTIETILAGKSEASAPYMLRAPRAGDFGWIVHRHGALYAQEYGWDEDFEALVASIVAEYVQKHDPEKERCWIAEQRGEIVGSVFLVKKTATVAKLRLLLVEPRARGLGIGRRLVQECVAFARSRGYRKITLWTNSVLHAARHIYEAEGFVLVDESPHHSFGHDLVGQTWELKL